MRESLPFELDNCFITFEGKNFMDVSMYSKEYVDIILAIANDSYRLGYIQSMSDIFKKSYEN